MVWGAISAAGKSQLIRLHGNINADQYQEQALANGLIPFLNNHNGNMHFMHDGAKPHTARTTTAWLAAHRVQVFGPWPSKSPDMNPIENCWSNIIEYLPGVAARTRDDLEIALRSAIEQVTLTHIRNWFTHCCYCTSPSPKVL